MGDLPDRPYYLTCVDSYAVWGAVDVTLIRIAMLFPQEIQMCHSFYVFRQKFKKAQGMPHRNNSGGNFHVVLQVGNIVDKTFVDFQYIQRKVLQISQR